MSKLRANWQYFLISQIAKGKFFLQPEIALGLGHQVARILGTDSSASTEDVDERSLEIICVDPSGKLTKLLYGGEDPNKNLGSIYDEAPKGSIAVIPLKGTLLKYGTYCDYGATELASFIREAAAHQNISAIVLDHDSGGGAVDAIGPLSQAIRFVKQSGKPIVANVDMACSAAYWTASECDLIVADNNISSMVGSIGVMFSFQDIRGYYEKMGVKFHTVYSSESGDKNQAFELALEGKYELLKEEMLDPLARLFQSTMKVNRSGKINLNEKGILNGKAYYADQALALGLIDRIGNSETAINTAIAMSHARKFI